MHSTGNTVSTKLGLRSVDERMQPDNSCGVQLEGIKLNAELLKLPKFTGDIIFTVYVVVWVIGLFIAMEKYQDGIV